MTELVNRAKRHLLQLAPHIKERETGQLMQELVDSLSALAPDESVRLQTIEECAAEVPSNWLDPLLTGRDAVLTGTYECKHVEALLNAIRQRILGRRLNSSHQQAPRRRGSKE